MTARGETVTVPYCGYLQAGPPPPDDAQMTRVGPGTPCGKFLRRFWHPVAMSSEINDLPVALRILGEDLVAFRDKRGQIGVLHRHCSHRGTSLEYGIVSERGIRCCYHGWLYDVDGTILETPGEPPDSKLKDSFYHGAYPAIEYKGLVFTYMGLPDQKPEFPIYDTFELPDNRLLPYAIPQRCNWLQIIDNTMDPIHAVFLHSRVSTVQLTDAWKEMPMLEFVEQDGGIYCVTTRRVDDMVWVRCIHNVLPNFDQTGALWVEAKEVTYFTRASLSKWIVPIDDTNSWTFGWRHFNDSVDPEHRGNEAEVGRGKMDFVGQSGDRAYEERQRNPGDWDVQVSQRPIAIHDLEHLAGSDVGVAMQRRLLKRAIDEAAKPAAPKGGAGNGHPIPTYVGDTVLRVPRQEETDDRALLQQISRRVMETIREGDRLTGEERQSHIENLLRGIH